MTKPKRRILWIKIGPVPFAEGNLRIAFHGQLLTQEGWRPVVFKEFMSRGYRPQHPERVSEANRGLRPRWIPG